MTDSTEDSQIDGSTESEKGTEESDDSDPELLTDGGVTLTADSTIQNGSTGPSVPFAPSNSDPTVTDSTASGQQGIEGPDPTRQFSGLGHPDHVALEPFHELCGQLEGIHRTDGELVVTLSSGILSFPRDSTEATICEDELVGKADIWVSILRTSNPDQPLMVHWVE